MKVLHVIARMNVGGTARYVGRLVESDPQSLLATGYVQGSEAEDPCVEKLRVARVAHMGRAINPVADFKSWMELKKIVKEFRPDIVHSHTFKAGLIARLVPGSFGRVHTFHGHLFDDQSFSALQKFVITWSEKFSARKTNVLISVGKKVGVELRDAGIGRANAWVSIPPGVDALGRIDKQSARERLGISGDGIIVGWMARVTSVKNPMLMIEVAKALPSVSFVVAGGGDMLDAVKSAAPSNVKAIGWADASAFWSAVDIALSTSDNEGMPVALIEAQLAGIPVVATDVGSNAEVIDDEVTGLVVEKDVTDLAHAVSRLVSDGDLRERMSVAAMDRASEEFGVKKMLESHALVYAGIQTSRSGGSH